MSTTHHKKVLISGASFAGLSTAYWMNKLGWIKHTKMTLSGQIKKVPFAS